MNIVKYRKLYVIFSTTLVLIGLVMGFINQSSGKGFFNYDIQFTGGTSIEGSLGQEFNNDDIAKIYKDEIGISNPQIQKVGDGTSVSIKSENLTLDQRDKILKVICEKYSVTEDNFTVTDISATISGEMREKAILAVTVSCLVMLLYITLRFKDFKIGASCVLALLNDTLIVIASYIVLRIPLNTSFIAVILTILGYSINASIIVFDRVRENKRTVRKIDDLVNISVTQTFTRSIFTTLTTFFTIFALYIFGVDDVKEFALPITIGIICGAYSSVCLAGSIWYIFEKAKPAKAK